MNRKSITMTGCVNFPVQSPEWHNALEGGTVVKLVVCEDPEGASGWSQCFGGGGFDAYREPLIGDDRRPLPTLESLELQHLPADEAIAQEAKAQKQWEAFHYPHQDEPNAHERLSREYLAILTLGSTGWTGTRADFKPWVCSFGDLNHNGQALYREIQNLYPKCSLHLLTYIDT